jgi:hypothetical protein
MDFYISIVVGITQAFIFNPVDKAIYNSIINNSKLFKRENWVKPFAGASNNIYTRIITSGLYFYLLDYTKDMNVYQSALTVSVTTAITLNPLNVVKYRSYCHNISTYQSLMSVYKKHGLKFCKIGLESLILRDFVFNVIYISNKKDNNDFVHNCSIICAASVISSPFHFYRNMKYYDNEKYLNITKHFYSNFKNSNKKLSYLIKQLAIGHGTVRTIIGLYTGQVMYSTLKQIAH